MAYYTGIYSKILTRSFLLLIEGTTKTISALQSSLFGVFSGYIYSGDASNSDKGFFPVWPSSFLVLV